MPEWVGVGIAGEQNLGQGSLELMPGQAVTQPGPYDLDAGANAGLPPLFTGCFCDLDSIWVVAGEQIKSQGTTLFVTQAVAITIAPAGFIQQGIGFGRVESD